VAYVPSKMEVSDRDWELTQALYGVDERDWDRRRVASELLLVCRSLDIPAVDTTEPLRRQERGGQSTYHARGGHWNRLGHATAALHIEDALRRERMPPDCGRRP